MEIYDILKSNGIDALGAESVPADYTHDECAGITGIPDAVVEACCTEDVAKVIGLCAGAGVPVTVRGAGTGKAGGSVAVNGGVVLSLKGMNKVIGFDEEAAALTVQPGMLLQDVKAEAAAHGLDYPPDPGEQTATIGGNASTNASGPSACKYGATKDYVLDATVVLADGSVAKLSEKPEYANILGSEGTLGVITELTLKLVKRPAKDVILLLPFMDSQSCISAAHKLSGFSPAVLEYLDTDLVEFSGKVTGNPVFPVSMDGERVGTTLMLQLEGEDDDSLDEQMEAVAELAEELECLDILVVDTPTLKREVWTAHDAFHTSMETAKSEGEMNVDVPPEAVAEFVEYAKGLSGGEVSVMAYAHVLSGGVHVHAASTLSKEEFVPVFAELAAAVYGKCSELGGDVSGEYGIGCAKTGYLAEEHRAAHRELKSELDPKGILNPGKVVV